MIRNKKLPARSQVKSGDTWDLSSLFKSDDDWECAFAAWEKLIPRYEKFRGTLGNGPDALAKCFEFDSQFDRAAERLGNYAHLKTTEDMADSAYQRMSGRYEHAATLAAEATSFIRPEILALPDKKLREYVDSKQLKPFRLQLERLIRYKPHTLGAGEEKLLAMQSEMAGAADRVFRQLTDADLKFGMCRNEKGESVELSHSSFSSFLRSPSRSVRRKAFDQYYAQFKGHENSLAAAYSSSVQKDVYYAKARNYPSAREASLFHDNVPVAVYDNLIAAVRGKLPAIYKYFDVRRKKMRLRDLHHYDTYVPILSELDTKHTWKQAVDVVVAALEPLGDEYCKRPARGPRRSLVRPLPEPGQTQRRVQLRHVRWLALHPHELPARCARSRLHAGPRSRPLDAHATIRPRTSPISITTTRSSWPKSPARSTSSFSADTSCI